MGDRQSQPPRASQFSPGGAKNGVANVDLIRNEDRNVRNSHRAHEDVLHHHLLDHGRNPGAHREREGLQHSSGGLMLHEGGYCFVRPSFASPFISTLV